MEEQMKEEDCIALEGVPLSGEDVKITIKGNVKNLHVTVNHFYEDTEDDE